MEMISNDDKEPKEPTEMVRGYAILELLNAATVVSYVCRHPSFMPLYLFLSSFLIPVVVTISSLISFSSSSYLTMNILSDNLNHNPGSCHGISPEFLRSWQTLALGVEVCQRTHVSAAALSRESFLYCGNCTMGEGRCVFFGGSEVIIMTNPSKSKCFKTSMSMCQYPRGKQY